MTKTYNDIMKVRLVGYTQPVDMIGIDDVQDLIAYCAKVSNPQFQTDFSRSEKLLNYLKTHAHWSPFEMASATMEVSTTRDIARQFLRHRSFSFQEFSQRYAVSEGFIQTSQARLQDEKNRQNSLPVEDRELLQFWEEQQHAVIKVAKTAYENALNNGIAKEVARAVLPEGLTPSHLYMSGSVRSWIHYIQLRTGNGTQKEHREIAAMCKLALLHVMPSLTEMLNEA